MAQHGMAWHSTAQIKWLPKNSFVFLFSQGRSSQASTVLLCAANPLSSPHIPPLHPYLCPCIPPLHLGTSPVPSSASSGASGHTHCHSWSDTAVHRAAARAWHCQEYQIQPIPLNLEQEGHPRTLARGYKGLCLTLAEKQEQAAV